MKDFLLLFSAAAASPVSWDTRELHPHVPLVRDCVRRVRRRQESMESNVDMNLRFLLERDRPLVEIMPQGIAGLISFFQSMFLYASTGYMQV